MHIFGFLFIIFLFSFSLFFFSFALLLDRRGTHVFNKLLQRVIFNAMKNDDRHVRLHFWNMHTQSIIVALYARCLACLQHLKHARLRMPKHCI